MLLKEEEFRDQAIWSAAQEILLALRTAPKTRGIDNLSLLAVNGKEKEMLAQKMQEISDQSAGKRPSFARDGANVLAASAVILLGVKSPPYGLDCGGCGHPTCAEKTQQHPKAPCVFGCIDLGIAAGSAAAALALRHIDNRVMYSIGYAALQLGWFNKETILSLGFPLSATGKSPFFDRK